MNDYYSRTQTLYMDGTKIWKSEEDKKNEALMARLVEQHEEFGGVKVNVMGEISPIDWYFESREGRLIGVGEAKHRTCESTKYRTTYIKVAKWLALLLAQTGLHVPALYFVRWTDGVMKSICVNSIDPKRTVINSTKVRSSGKADKYPYIEIPLDHMTDITPQDTGEQGSAVPS